MLYCIKVGKYSKLACNAILNENVNFEQMMGPYMLKWYLRIYIFIEYLKCVWKSNYIWIIRNDSKKIKKKSKDPRPRVRVRPPGRVPATNSFSSFIILP